MLNNNQINFNHIEEMEKDLDYYYYMTIDL